MSDRETLEKKLLQNPFDAATRRQYALMLLERREFEASLTQWRLLIAQQASADAHLQLALCCQGLGDEHGVREQLALARGCSDFRADDPRLHELEPAGPPALQLVRGGKSVPREADVISISRAEKVRFSDVVGMQELKRMLRVRVIEPLVNPGLFQRFKKQSGGGVLLYGPPGCGKTMIARAVASECNASFTAVGISDILNMWVGQSERNLAGIFERARGGDGLSVLFFDELDALAFARGKAHSDHTRTLVNEFLSQLDGFAKSDQRMLILGATNMPWDVDDAMKRPGRFDRQIFVPPPDAEARAEMFRQKLRDVPHQQLDEAALARASDHFSGADIDGVIEQAKDAVIAAILDGEPERTLTQRDLAAAITATTPSTLEWLKTAKNLVKFGGSQSYKDVEQYLRKAKLY